MSAKHQRMAFLLAMLLGLTLSWTGFCKAEEEGFTPVPVIKGMELLKPGMKAPMFSVKDLDGNTFDLSKEVGKNAFLFVFWSIYCEPCRDEMPLIEKIKNQYKGKGLEVLSINLDGDPFIDAVKGFIKQTKYTFRVLMDELRGENFVIADPYSVAGTPVIYAINKRGEVSFNVLGRITEEDLKAKIEQVLAAQ